MHHKIKILSTIMFLCTIITSKITSQTLGLQIEDGQDVLFGESWSGDGGRLMWIDQKKAFRAGDLGFRGRNNWDPDSVGLSSFAFGADTRATQLNSGAWGKETLASGEESTAWGDGTVASGEGSTTWGIGTEAASTQSTAWGYYAKAIGVRSTAWGWRSEANSPYSTAWGFETKANSSYGTAWGKGTEASSNQSTAWGYETEASGLNSTAWGFGSIAGGNESTAWGINTHATSFRSTAWGEETQATSSNSTAWGDSTVASGQSSTSWGNRTIASWPQSTAWGYQTEAAGPGCTAWGKRSFARGFESTAWGDSTIAYGNTSTAWGRGTTARTIYETTLGSYNTDSPSNSINMWEPEQRLFGIGNGTSESARSDALVLLKKGFLGLGASEPDALLHLSNAITGIASGIKLTNNTYDSYMYHDFYGSLVFRKEGQLNQLVLKDNGNIGLNIADPIGQFTIKQSTGANNSGLRLISNADNASWEIRNTSGSDNLRIRAFADDGTLDHTVEIDRTDGAYLMNSDIRLKKDIEYMDEALSDILRISPALYNWKKNTDQRSKSIGVIAQELEVLFPYAVHTNEEGYKMVNYDALGVLAIQAVKEQQTHMSDQQSEIDQLRIANQKLSDRLKKIESLLSGTRNNTSSLDIKE